MKLEYIHVCIISCALSTAYNDSIKNYKNAGKVLPDLVAPIPVIAC